MKLLCVFLTVSITERNSDKNAKSERKGNNYKKIPKRMKRACQNLLAKRYGIDKVEPYWQKVEERYNQILDEAPDIGSEANSMSHNLYEVAWIIALYDVVGRDLTKEEIDTVIHDVMEDGLNTLHKIPGKFLLERKVYTKSYHQIVR